MARGKHRKTVEPGGRGRYFTLGLTMGLFLAMSLPTLATGWTDKVTGGGWAAAGGAEFSLTMAASDVGGQWQYTREGVNVAHGTIDCVFVAPDGTYAVMSGPVTHVSEGTLFVEGTTWTIAVREGGEGSGDGVRIWSGDECGTPYGGGYPGTYFDGNVNIRTK